MRRLQKAIEKAALALSSVLLAIMIIILIYNVFARFLGGGVAWYMEASQYLNIWGMLIAGVAVCAAGQHLRIDGLETMMGGGWKVANRVVVALVTIAFYAFFTYGSFLFATKARQTIATMAPLKMSYVYWMMPVCGALSMVSTALCAVISVQDAMKKGDAT